MPTSSQKVNDRISAVCETGCEAVRASIQLLEKGVDVEVSKDLSPAERELMLKELKAIMSVYDKH